MRENNKEEFAKKSAINLGLDLGSVSLNTVVLDQTFQVLEEHYDFIYGKPFHTLLNRLTDLLTRYSAEDIGITAITGSGGKFAAELIGGTFVNEVIAQATAVSRLYPE